MLSASVAEYDIADVPHFFGNASMNLHTRAFASRELRKRLRGRGPQWRRRLPEPCCLPLSGGWGGTAWSRCLGPCRRRAGSTGPP
jgi:hypothetical protein